LCIFFGGRECVGHSFAYVANFVFLRDVWIRTQRAAVASRLATNLATHLPPLAILFPPISNHLAPKRGRVVYYDNRNDRKQRRKGSDFMEKK
jgi:hypothetical protein